MWLYSFIIGAVFLIVMALMLAMKRQHYHYKYQVLPTMANLQLSRKSISLFAEQNGRFPNSLDELNEYATKFPDKIKWHFAPRESISGRKGSQNRSSEHSVLDGSGGIYYNPETGQLKVNLNKPLKSYWWFYFGKKRNEIPADW